jgi:hypothetical protein
MIRRQGIAETIYSETMITITVPLARQSSANIQTTAEEKKRQPEIDGVVIQVTNDKLGG